MENILNDPLFWLAVENSSYRPTPDARMRLDVGGNVLYNTKESKWHSIGLNGVGRTGHQGRGTEMGYTSYTLRFHWPRKFTVEATYYSSMGTAMEREKTTGRIREVFRVYPQFNEPPVLTLIGKTDRAFVEEALVYIKLCLK